MKGMLLAMMTTILVVLIAVFAILASVFAYSLIVLSGEKIEQRFIIVDILNRPYSFADVYTITKINDRTVLEDAIESVSVSSVEKSSSSLYNSVALLNSYEFQNYFLYLYSGDTEIFSAQKGPVFCSEDPVGICDRAPELDCGVGYIIDPESSDKCKFGEICCKLADPIEYNDRLNIEVKNCGPQNNKFGICDKDFRGFGGYATQKIDFCGSGKIRVPEGDLDCIDINDGRTPLCCAIFTQEVRNAIESTIEIPLLFKDKVGRLVVTIE